MGQSQQPTPTNAWVRKFRNAFRGIKAGVRGQSSFFAHFLIAAAVLTAAGLLGAGCNDWCLLVLCIVVVLAAEMFNSALEAMARAVSDRRHPDLGAALDIASAAVLIAALGASVVGTIVLMELLTR